jgi:hypothetical protein
MDILHMCHFYQHGLKMAGYQLPFLINGSNGLSSLCLGYHNLVIDTGPLGYVLQGLVSFLVADCRGQPLGMSLEDLPHYPMRRDNNILAGLNIPVIHQPLGHAVVGYFRGVGESETGKGPNHGPISHPVHPGGQVDAIHFKQFHVVQVHGHDFLLWLFVVPKAVNFVPVQPRLI